MSQPRATSTAVPKPNSSAPSRAAITMSRPLRSPPSVRRLTRSRSRFATKTCCVSASPSSQGTPAFLIDESGEAPVPPACDETRHLEAGKLAALARLRALRDLDFELVCALEIAGRDPEPRRRDL